MQNDDEWLADAYQLRAWAADIFLFAHDTMGMLPSEPLDELRGKPIAYTNAYGEKREAYLFDDAGKLVWHDLTFYTVDMFKNQEPAAFKEYGGTRFTWQQTIILEAYNRAIGTFGRDSFHVDKRWITTRSGHGIGKTACEAIIANHFLLCLPGSQIGMTANTEQQVQDVFMKEFGVWRAKLPDFLRESLVMTNDHIRVEESDDWFLRAQVARPEKPEALAGLHGPFVLILVDEASGVADKVIEVMKGALTGDNYIVMFFSNATRTEGEFYESHKPGSAFTKLHFTSRESPIVKPGFIEKMEADYGPDSDEVRIRVDGEFANVAEMDDHGWIPLFANLNILFEPERGQIINGAIIGADPAGTGRDSSIVHVRDSVYLKEVLNEATSSAPDLARKIETIRDIYRAKTSDIGIDAFGIGAQVVAHIASKIGESVNAILADKPRPGTEAEFHSFKAELAWRFRQWVTGGGIIITNNPQAWLRDLSRIKYKRDRQGRIQLQDKETFKKLWGHSPDRFDAACYTFFKLEATREVVLTAAQMQTKEAVEFLQRAQSVQAETVDGFSSM